MDRRRFLQSSMIALGVSLLPGGYKLFADEERPLFRISLAEWSLHRMLRSGELDHLEFPAFATDRFGIDAVEYVNQFFKHTDESYLKELKSRANNAGVRSVLIMCDGEGKLGDPEETKRVEAVQNHVKWLDAAQYLGCHSIRVNAESEGSYDEQMHLVADGLRRLCELADSRGLNVIVENHGGISNDAEWLVKTIKEVDHPRCGTLPDFGNFIYDPKNSYDPYQGVRLMMPYAKGVSAKSRDFNAQGNETTIDFFKMMRIVLDSGYHSFVGIEYEGDELSEIEGVHATKRLLERVRKQFTTRPE